MRRIVLVTVLLAGGCHRGRSAPSEPAGRWLDARGRAEGLAGCLRLAASLRAACRGDGACERDVSEHVSFECHAGSYAARQESPCVGDHGPARCRSLELPAALVAHCEAELRLYAEDICTRGDPTLTGAGP